MKTTVKKSRTRKPHLYVYRRPYPNAADPIYYIDKVIDIALAVVTGMGSVSALLFLAIM